MNIHSVGEEKYATKPESNWDAGANNTPRTKQVAEAALLTPEEVQPMEEETAKLSSSSIRSQSPFDSRKCRFVLHWGSKRPNQELNASTDRRIYQKTPFIHL